MVISFVYKSSVSNQVGRSEGENKEDRLFKLIGFCRRREADWVRNRMFFEKL